MNRNLGGIERPKDERDFQLGSIQAPAAIPPSYTPDISWLIRNFQGQTPACGAHAGSHLQAILEHLVTPAASQVNQRYTPRYLWIRIKQIDGFPLTAGTDMRSIFKTLQANGAANFEPLENDVTLPLSAYSSPSAVTSDMDANAAHQKIQSYAFSGTDFHSICQSIYQNQAVLLLIKCDDGYFGTATPTFTTTQYGHFVCAYGYTPNCIKIVDSADIDFPLKEIGIQYIKPKFILEAGTAIDLPPDTVKAIVQQSADVAQEVAVSTLPPQQKVSILTVIRNFLQSLFPKVGATSQPMTNYNAFLSKTNWSAIALIVWQIGTAALPVVPTAYKDIVSAILGILVILFHLDGVTKAAVASADATAATATGAVATPVSGQ